MVKRFILLIMFALISIFCTTFLACAGEEDKSEYPITITHHEEEFLKGDALSDWVILVESSDFKNIGFWGDGSFFVHIGSNLNIYYANGDFSHCLNLHSRKGGAVNVRTLDDGAFEILLFRENCILKTDKAGKIITCSYASQDELDQIYYDYFCNFDRKWFSVSEHSVFVNDKEHMIKLPARLSIPFFSNSHFIIENQENDLLFDDNGIVVFRNFLLFILLFVIVAVILVICIKLNKKSAKRLT